MATTTRTPSILMVGRTPPPIGGVTQCVADLTKTLREGGTLVRPLEVGYASRLLRQWPGVLRHNTLALAHLSRFSRLAPFSAVAQLVRSPIWAVMHGGSFVQEWEELNRVQRKHARKRLACFARLLVTNADLAALVTDSVGLEPPTLVSPTCAATLPTRSSATRKQRAVVACFEGRELYGLEIAVGAIERLHSDGVADLSLAILLYGPSADSLELECGTLPWVEVHRNRTRTDVHALIAESTVFLRPTSTDGDSLLLREAQALGTRCIASKAAPRPEAVETCGRSIAEFRRAYASGGLFSDGAGLGRPIDDVVLEGITPS